MPSQLYNNSAVEFLCARDFTFNGVEYHLGDDFPQDDAGKSLEVLVRTRRVIPVVDDRSDKPRHWFREIRVKSEVMDKLKTNDSEHVLGRRKQIDLNVTENVPGEYDQEEDTQDNGLAINETLTNRIEEDDMARPGKQDIKLVNGQEETEPVALLNLSDDDKVEYKEIDSAETAESDFQKDLYDGKVVADEVDVAPPTHEDPSNSDYAQLFDPNTHTVEEVNEHLKNADGSERERVYAAEQEGKARKGVLGSGDEDNG